MQTDSQPWRILVVGSSHNDIGWAGTPSEIAEHREHGIIDAVLDLLDRDPGYAYAVEASLYADEYLGRNPQRAGYLRALVESGRLEWGGTYVQPYEGLYGGEGLLRQVEHGRKALADRYGIASRGAWNVDVQGRTRNLAQIYGPAGIDYLVVSRCRPGVYWWEAADGSRLLVLSLFQGHYGYPFLNTRVLHTSPLEEAVDGDGDFDVAVAAARLRELVGRFEPVFAEHDLPRALLVCVTADYTVPSVALSSFVDTWNARATEIAAEFGVHARLEFGTADAYVALLAKDGAIDRLPVVRGEMPNPWLYIHGPGHHKTVDALRRSQSVLLTAERLRGLPLIFGVHSVRTDTVDLDRAWRDHVYIDHGFGGLHGVGTDEVFRVKAEAALHAGLRAIDAGLAGLAGGLGLGADEIVVYNPFPRTRSDWVEAEVATAGRLAGAVRLTGPDGAAAIGHVLAQGAPAGSQRGYATVGFVAPDVPGLGYAVFRLTPTPAADPGPALRQTDGDISYSNDHYTAVITRGGLYRLSRVRPGRPEIPVARTDAYLFGETIAVDSPGIDVGMHEQSGFWDYQLPRPYQPRITRVASTGNRGDDPRLVLRTDALTRVVTEAPIAGARVRNTYTLYRDLPYLDLRVDVLGWTGEHGRELRLCFPFAGADGATTVRYEVPFGSVTAGVDEIEDFGDMRPREVQSWIQAADGQRSLTLSGSVAVYDWLDVVPGRGGTVLQAILLATKRSCHSRGNWYEQRGDHTFHVRIDPTGTVAPTDLGWGRELALRARPGDGPVRGPGSDPVRGDGRGSGDSVRSAPAWAVPDAANVLLTCLKPVGPDAVLIRYWEHEGRATAVHLTSLPGDITLFTADPFGGTGVALDGPTVHIPAHGLVTVVARKRRG
ncbi:MAG: alpha-mannosidase [Mycobacteriales bacterium]